MMLARKGLEVPIEWRHDALLQNKYLETVAMLNKHVETTRGNARPWCYHDPTLVDKDGWTVAMHMAHSGM